MVKFAYLTVDDGPTPTTSKYLEILDKYDIRGLFFCRGERMVENWSVLVESIRAGHVIGNHSFYHKPASVETLEDWIIDLTKTEDLIQQAYEEAGQKRPGKFYRFPYLDRGDGERLERLLTNEVDHKVLEPIGNPSESVIARQKYLSKNNFRIPFEDVQHPIFEINKVFDCLVTYSTWDWRMTKRHLEKEPIGVDFLKNRFEQDQWLHEGEGRHVILFHDDPDDLSNVFDELLQIFINKGFVFVDVANASHG